MKYKKIGEEGKKISELGMGCYALSGAYGEVDKRKFQTTLDYAESLGINYFDTAESYGEEAERILGEVVKPYRDDIVLSTKIGGSPKNEKSPVSCENVKASCERSLERLQTDYIDIYFVHFDDLQTEVTETVEALDELKEDGKIRHYGVSHLPVKRIEEYLKEGDVSFCMMELSAAARENRKELLPLCRDHGAEAIAFSVTGRGILTGRFDGTETFEKNDLRNMDPLFKKERFRSSLRVTEKLEEIGEKYDKTPVQVAINWVLSQEGVISALTGTSSKDHLEENVGGAGWRLEKSGLDDLESFLGKEEEILERKENEIIKDVLNTEPSDDLEEAFNDLVYVMEVSGSRGIVDERDIEPIFRKLFSLRKERNLELSKIMEIRQRLKEIIDI